MSRISDRIRPGWTYSIVGDAGTVITGMITEIRELDDDKFQIHYVTADGDLGMNTFPRDGWFRNRTGLGLDLEVSDTVHRAKSPGILGWFRYIGYMLTR